MSICAARSFDRWVHTGPFTPLDLGVYRIVYAVSTLVITRDITWLNEYPSALYDPPPGPFKLLSSIPPAGVLLTLELALSLVLVMLGLGLATKVTSFAASILLMLTFGFTYTLGKIDHTILMVVAPLILAFANWGDRLSIDAVYSRRASLSQKQWPLRLLAFVIGLAFFLSAQAKFQSGYLGWSTQAVRGFFFQFLITEDRAWLSDVALSVPSKVAWEAIDWFAVILEFAVLASLPWWGAFRAVLAVAAIFHLGVFLLLGIVHVTEVIVYGAFVSWGAVLANQYARRPIQALGGRATILISAALLLGIGAVKTLMIVTGRDPTEYAGSVAILFTAALIGIAYLGLVMAKLRRKGLRGP